MSSQCVLFWDPMIWWYKPQTIILRFGTCFEQRYFALEMTQIVRFRCVIELFSRGGTKVQPPDCRFCRNKAHWDDSPDEVCFGTGCDRD